MKRYISILLFISISCWGDSGNLSGTVEKIRLHQYLNGSGWDEYTWFCLDTAATVGTCVTTAACSGNTSLVISKDARPELYSTVLAARLSGQSITVHVNDSYKFGDHCYARIVDL